MQKIINNYTEISMLLFRLIRRCKMVNYKYSNMLYREQIAMQQELNSLFCCDIEAIQIAEYNNFDELYTLSFYLKNNKLYKNNFIISKKMLDLELDEDYIQYEKYIEYKLNESISG